MSYAEREDWSSGYVTLATIVLATIAVPLTAIAALEAIVVWGEFSGWGFVNRAICLLSPIYAAGCLLRAKAVNGKGRHRDAYAWLAALALPLLSIVGLIILSIVRS